MELFRSTILVCGGTGCTSSGSMKLYERFEQLLAENGLDKETNWSEPAASAFAPRDRSLLCIPRARSTAM